MYCPFEPEWRNWASRFRETFADGRHAGQTTKSTKGMSTVVKVRQNLTKTSRELARWPAKTSPKISAFPVRRGELSGGVRKIPKKRRVFGYVWSVLVIEGPDSSRSYKYNYVVKGYRELGVPICCLPRQSSALGTEYSSDASHRSFS